MRGDNLWITYFFVFFWLLYIERRILVICGKFVLLVILNVRFRVLINYLEWMEFLIWLSVFVYDF